MALVDTGTQSTIISREVLHTVVKHIHTENQEPSVIKFPIVKLYGKSGKEENREFLLQQKYP